jgi:hypothetical protein
MTWLMDARGIYLQQTLGGPHSARRCGRSGATRPPSLARTTPPVIALFCGGCRLNLLDENFPEDQLPLLKHWIEFWQCNRVGRQRAVWIEV